MGLDAFVRCRCFEEGKLKPGPIPFEDLYIDDEDYISSKFLDQKRKELSSEQSHNSLHLFFSTAHVLYPSF